MDLHGVFPPIPTPFDGGELDLGALGRNCDRWLAAGLHGLVALGSNGEAPLLDDAESDRVIETVRAHVPPERLLIAGVARESTAGTIRAARRAAALGADALLVRTPSFFKPWLADEALVDHYTAVAEAAPAPVLLYNFPALTGLSLTVPAVARLAAHPNIAGMKESGADIGFISELIDATPDDFDLLAGSAPAFLASLLAGAACGVLLLWGAVPADGFLRNPETGSLLRSPLLSGIVAFLFAGGTAVGVAYGAGAGTFRNDTDVMNGMGKTLGTLGTYLVLVFFAAQFVAYFNWSNLGLIIAVKGADALRASGLGGISLMLAFVLLSSFINLVMGSASAKWAVMAPVFVPMFMFLGYTPELTQVAYRIGDSTSNVIAPMMAYFALIVAFFERYDRRSGIGTVVATMLPYTVVFLVVWSLLLMVWMLLGLPLGPGAGLRLP